MNAKVSPTKVHESQNRLPSDINFNVLVTIASSLEDTVPQKS